MKKWQAFQFLVNDLNQCLNNLEIEGWHIFSTMKHGSNKVLVVAYKES